MTLIECYAAMGGDYAGAIGRLRSDALLQKFALKFINDATFEQLKAAFESRDRETAFRAAHTLKGVCQNLGFAALGDSSSELTEALRNDWTPEADILFPQVEADYRLTMDALNAFQAGL